MGETIKELMQGFHRISRKERLERLRKLCQLTDEEVNVLSGETPVSPELAENFIENVIGYFPIPFGVATYFKIDGHEIPIPMAVEETSIIAAASASAKWISRNGVIRTYCKGRLIIGQIQIPHLRNVKRAREILQESRDLLLGQANEAVPNLVRRGGGVRDLAIREVPRFNGNSSMLVLHVLCDPCDAMGANLINQVCESLKPRIEKMIDEKVGLCILSNLMDGRLAVSEVEIRGADPKLGEGIVAATEFAKSDVYRATTHNKGVLNGIDPILIATGNDWRAVEAGVHAYATRSGRYQPVTNWWMENGSLRGRFEAPMAVGTVGGVTKSHPMARICLKMMKVRRSEDLARICAAVGLVQNLGALKALSTEGIVRGHMSLHAANLAMAVGADYEEIPKVREALAHVLKTEKAINMSRARSILEEIRGRKPREDFEQQNQTL